VGFASESSEVLNIVLCGVYEISCDKHNPTFECIVDAISAFKKYGLTPLRRFVSPPKPLYHTLLYHAPLRPLETYALAAEFELEDLAVASSAYTLPLNLALLSEDLALKMGSVYLHRLHRLHGARMDALRELLDRAIYPHVAKPYCSIEKRREFSKAYDLACAQLYYDAFPGQSHRLLSSPHLLFSRTAHLEPWMSHPLCAVSNT
jgi:hypothetical protein